MIRLERTNSRHIQHLWCGLAYIGAVEDGNVVLVPHVAEFRDAILIALPRSLQGLPVKVGIPAQRYLTLNEAKMAKPLAKRRGRPPKVTTPNE